MSCQFQLKYLRAWLTVETQLCTSLVGARLQHYDQYPWKGQGIDGLHKAASNTLSKSSMCAAEQNSSAGTRFLSCHVRIDKKRQNHLEGFKQMFRLLSLEL